MTKPQKPPSLPSLPPLPMPLRDMVRGLGSLAEATEERLEPAVSLLPGPVREVLNKARETLQEAGLKATGLHVGQEEIRQAAAFLNGEITGSADALTRVLADCAQRLASGEGRHLLFSETVARAALTTSGDTSTTGFERTAGILRRLADAHIVGHAPGAPISLSVEAQGWAKRLYLTCFVWLLSERPEKLEEEHPLFDLAATLVASVEGEAASEPDDPASCAALLERLSGQL